jgi:hypothetical protein
MKGLNRIGNMLVPNSNYCKFEDWIMPILDQMLEEQNKEGVNWTPSKVGREDPKTGPFGRGWGRRFGLRRRKASARCGKGLLGGWAVSNRGPNHSSSLPEPSPKPASARANPIPAPSLLPPT